MIQREFIGKKLKVLKSSNKNLEGIEGMIIDETKHFFMIEINGVIKKIQKKGCIFQIEFNDQEFEINGGLLLVSPEERVKLKVK